MKAYYYAGGTRIELQPDDEHVAVDRSRVPASLVDMLSADASASATAHGDIVVAPVKLINQALDAREVAALRREGALGPVYRRDLAMLVPLPEVRVEVDDDRQRDAVKRYVAAGAGDWIIAEESSDRLVLKPRSGRPLDALNIANEIYEKAHPAASSVRFLQFVPRPSVKR